MQVPAATIIDPEKRALQKGGFHVAARKAGTAWEGKRLLGWRISTSQGFRNEQRFLEDPGGSCTPTGKRGNGRTVHNAGSIVLQMRLA